MNGEMFMGNGTNDEVNREVSGPLSGIKVIDFTTGLNGPCSGVWLSDYGAEVLKIEPRVTGEYGRGLMPVPDSQFTPYFVCGSRGKKSVAIDLKKKKGLDVILKLVDQCDVLISNFRIGVLDKLGLGYEELKKRNPKIIYAVSSSYGANGPMAELPCNDYVAQAYSGLAGVTGSQEEPMPAGGSPCDLSGSFSLTLGVMLAIVARERFGIGQRVDTSLYGGGIMLQTWEIDHYSMLGKLPDPLRAGRFHSRVTRTMGVQKTKDGFMMTTPKPGETSKWSEYCNTIGAPELIDNPRLDPRIATYEDQVKNAEELSSALDTAFQKKTTKEWMEILPGMRWSVSPIRTYEDVVNDPQSTENGYIIEMDLPGLGKTKLAGMPAMLSETPAKAQGIPPEVGQHTEMTLLELGYSWEEITQMRDEEVI